VSGGQDRLRPVLMPHLGETVEEATVGAWLKRPGDHVAVDESLLEVLTDKVNAEVPSPLAGTIVRVLVPEGATVPIGTPLAELELDPAPGEAARFEHPGRFIACDADAATASVHLFGIPMDWTASFQPGSRLGPVRIREASYGLETYSPALDRDLAEVRVADRGDVVVPIGNVAKSLRAIRAAAEDVAASGARWLALGGEHLVTLPLVEAAAARWPDLAVIHWDAHTDLADQYLGEPLSHATVLRRVAERIAPGSVYQFGIRSGTRDEFLWAHTHTRLYRDAIREPLAACLDELRNRPVYFTLDVDVLDPAFLPGTGTPEPGGVSPAELFSALYLLSALNLVGADVVETMPGADVSQRTALVAAKIVRELLLVMTAHDRQGT
jgi:agmatinase